MPRRSGRFGFTCSRRINESKRNTAAGKSAEDAGLLQPMGRVSPARQRTGHLPAYNGGVARRDSRSSAGRGQWWRLQLRFERREGNRGGGPFGRVVQFADQTA